MSSRCSRSGGRWIVTPRKPIVEVLAKPAAFDHRIEVLVGRGNDADIGRDGLAPAQPLESPLLQQPQDLGLGARGHVADFVQQQRAAVGLLELADAPAVGPGKRPALVAEEFAFQERLGNGRAVDGQERRLAAAAVMVDGASDQFLARAAFPKISTFTSCGATRPICLQTVCMAVPLPISRSGLSSGRSPSSRIVGTCIRRLMASA